MNTHVGALRLVGATLSEGIRPRPRPRFVDWLQKNIVLVDGPKKGEFWSIEDAPYLPAIAECLDLSHPANFITARKCQQSGVSILALAWCLYLAEHAPDNILYGVPGVDALAEMSGEKLQPMIDEWQKATGKRVILPVTTRASGGSSTHKKKFPGGVLILANANTVMDLSAKTARYGVQDELSKWQMLPNGADPETLFFGRFTAFRRQKSYKIFRLSTPEYDSGDELGEGPGHCRIDRSYIRSDQRVWMVRCPHCDEEFVQTRSSFEIDRDHPHRSCQVCPNGHRISETERVSMVRVGRYVATESGPDLHPGFHIDAFMSLMMSYEAIAEDFLASEGKGEAGEKDFSNLVLALPYAMRGNAPDHQRLMERREDYPEGRIPAEGLIFVGGADVGHNEIYVELVAFAEDRQSWSVHVEIIDGSTDDPNAGAWLRLDELYRQSFPDAFGNGDRRIEALAVDAGDGNRTTQVLEWCRRRPNTYAVKGMPGRGVPAISLPQKRSVNRRGKRQKFKGAQTWPVGTWSLKGELYGNLHKVGVAAGEPEDPPGYCHFARWHGEDYFKMVTAEYFHTEIKRGRLVEEWRKIRRDNHFLDTRIYAMAMAEHLGLSRLTADGWARLRARFSTPQVDLLSGVVEQIAAEPETSAQARKRPTLSEIAASLNS